MPGLSQGTDADVRQVQRHRMDSDRWNDTQEVPMRTAAATVACLVASLAAAGDARVIKSFTLDARHDVVVKWIEAHQSECREAMKVFLVSEDDGVMTLRREHRRGVFEWRQRDIVTSEPGRWMLQSSLVEGLRGGIKELTGEVKLTADGDRTSIEASTRAEVIGISDQELRVDLHGRGRRLEELLRKEVEQ
jgi:hypothetical protein